MTTEAMRAEFEAFANGKYELKLRRSGGYDSGTTEGAWRTWRAATLTERERAAKVCDAEHVGDGVNDECDSEGDKAYNMALRHAASAIRKGGGA